MDSNGALDLAKNAQFSQRTKHIDIKMLLRQPDMNAFEDVISTEEVVEDWESSEDIPAH
jgi:hypothetical protein